jgi:hypothetical protein
MDAQTVTNLLTAGLGIGTVWLAVETRRMASAARNALELESQPFLSFRGLRLARSNLRSLSDSSDAAGLRVALRLFNPGKVRVYYAVEEFRVAFSDGPSAQATFNTRGDVVHPTEENLFYYPWVATPGDLHLLNAGTVHFRISYWSSPKVKSSLAARLSFTITATSPLDWEWIYEEGPTYG